MTFSSRTQLRIDFLAFTLSGPNPTGFCVNDYLAVTGGASLVPRICGENADEHGKTLVHVFVLRNFEFLLCSEWVMIPCSVVGGYQCF
jgi:hypothetical protein